MATRFINGLLSTVDINQTTDSSAIKVFTGTVRTDGFHMEIFDENSSSYLSLAGDVGDNVTYVKEETDFGTAVSGEITLTDGMTYVLCDSVTLSSTLVIANTNRITDSSLGANTLSYTGS